MKRFIKISMILLCVFILTGCDFGKEETYKYKLALFNLNEIDNVTIDTLGQYDNTIEITDKSKIKVIYYMFEGKKSNVESEGDNPDNPDKLYSVSFNTEHNTRSLFIYKKDDKYYIEEANLGIYESNEDDFEKLESMLKDNNYIDDKRYIEKAVNEFMALKNLSIKELRYKLIVKGINTSLIEEFISLHKEELEEFELTSANKLYIKKQREMHPDEIINYLRKKGYKEETIRRIQNNE